MTYPTISISLNEERTEKLLKLVRQLRNADETISRSEVVGKAIDRLYLSMFSTEARIDLPEEQARAAA